MIALASGSCIMKELSCLSHERKQGGTAAVKSSLQHVLMLQGFF